LPPGVILSVAWNPNYYIGKRVIPLHGQGIPINDDYQQLVNATYVGDSLNDTAHFFYKYNSSTNARDTSGDYFRLPDTKALVPKGRGDLGAGATYFGGRVKNNSNIMGNLQEDSLENHVHYRLSLNESEETTYRPNQGTSSNVYNIIGSVYLYILTGGNVYNGRTSNQTRDSSFAVDFVITY
jgi:hypothetical protein